MNRKVAMNIYLSHSSILTFMIDWIMKKFVTLNFQQVPSFGFT